MFHVRGENPYSFLIKFSHKIQNLETAKKSQYPNIQFNKENRRTFTIY